MKLDKDVVPVPIEAGTWNVASLEQQVGWLTTTGQRPGGDLAVTLIGHVTVAPAVYGPFAGIGRLKRGDSVIYLWDGVEYAYEVEGMENVAPDDVERLYVADGSRLLLVTCSGYDFLFGRYGRRLIISAVLAGSPGG